MLKNYNIITIYGRDKELFPLIGPFAMNRNVIRQMDGYPILSDENTVWFIAIKDESVASFGAVRKTGDNAEFTYSYTASEHREKGLHAMLFKERLAWCKRNGVKILKADCTASSLPYFKKAGFKIVKEFQKWTKVEKEL